MREIFTIYVIAAISLQIFFSLFILPFVWRAKCRYTIYEARLSDGQDISILMLCTIFLLLSPLIMPIVIIGTFCELSNLLKIRRDWMTDKSYERITKKYDAINW
jgi:hypothetical protein